MADGALTLKYGINPHQKPASLRPVGSALPFKIRNGNPGYINLLDALNAWQLVSELKSALGHPAAASFKHVSPAGAAIGLPLTGLEKKALLLPEELEPSPVGCALLRARGADPVSSFGDFIAVSDPVDEATAELLRREVSDGIIAPGYEPAAFEILSAKKKGAYVVLEADPEFVPPAIERRELFGVEFTQGRNDAFITPALFKNIVTTRKEFPAEVAATAVVALVALKYTQSNSVAFAVGGQAIGIGAGQQSRIHCTRIAADKAETWMLRRHPVYLGLGFREGMSRTEKYNALDMCIHYDQLTPPEREMLRAQIAGEIPVLSREEKEAWFRQHEGIVYASDAFLPFRDNIDRAAATGARYVVQPGGSVRDEDVIQAADEYGMVMTLTGLRLFTH